MVVMEVGLFHVQFPLCLHVVYNWEMVTLVLGDFVVALLYSTAG